MKTVSLSVMNKITYDIHLKLQESELLKINGWQHFSNEKK